MKLQSTLLIVILMAAPTVSYCQQNGRLMGEWIDVKDINHRIHFHADSSVEIVNEGKSSLRKNVISYRVDYTKNPKWIDLILQNASGESTHVKGVLDFVSDSLIKVCFSKPGEVRPLDFNNPDKNQTAILIQAQYYKFEPTEEWIEERIRNRFDEINGTLAI